MKIKEIVSKIENFAPLSVSHEAIANGSHDNSGFLIGNDETDLCGIVVCIDVCDDAINLALEKGCNLILSHHPFIYYPINNVSSDNYKGRLIQKLIKHDLSVYCSHLSMDLTVGGVDDVFAKMCEINVETVFEKMSYGGYGKFGSVEFDTFESYLKMLKTKFDVVNACENNQKIEKVASFCGAGLSPELVEQSIKNGASVVISCDIPNHFVVELSENGINVVNCQHGESELKAFWKIIESLNLDTKVVLCEKDFRLINR